MQVSGDVLVVAGVIALCGIALWKNLSLQLQAALREHAEIRNGDELARVHMYLQAQKHRIEARAQNTIKRGTAAQLREDSIWLDEAIRRIHAIHIRLASKVQPNSYARKGSLMADSGGRLEFYRRKISTLERERKTVDPKHADTSNSGKVSGGGAIQHRKM